MKEILERRAETINDVIYKHVIPEINIGYSFGEGTGIFPFEHKFYVFSNERNSYELYGPYSAEEAVDVAVRAHGYFTGDRLEWRKVNDSMRFYH